MNRDPRNIQVQGDPAQENLHRIMTQMNDVPIAYHEDWQEELYQKIKHINETYDTDIREIYQIVSKKIDDTVVYNEASSSVAKLNRTEAPNAINMDRYMKFKMILERLLALLENHSQPQSLTQQLKHNIPHIEKNIVYIIKFYYPHRPHVGESSTFFFFPKIHDLILLSTYENDIMKKKFMHIVLTFTW